MISTWLQQRVTIYANHSDVTGKQGFIKDVLQTPLSKEIKELRNVETNFHEDFGISELDYKKQKAAIRTKISCWTPAGYLKSRATDNVQEISKTGLLQLDFDYKDIWQHDIQKLKQHIFNISFVGYCGLSCSGKGIFALILIAEPEKLKDYAEHCFEVLSRTGLNVDRSKGRNVTDLRYFSYDENALIRENPKPLRIKHYLRPPASISTVRSPKPYNALSSSQGLLNSELIKIEKAQVGHRWQTVQQVAFTLGGLGNLDSLEAIKNTINNNNAFAGEENKYIKCAKVCFKAGMEKPLQTSAIETFKDI